MIRALVVVAAVTFLASAAPATGERKQTAVNVRNGIDEEFTLVLSRTRVKPGPAIIQYTNTGEDPHDLRVQRRGSKRVRSLPELEPGGVDSLSFKRLKPASRYDLWCSLDGHRESGMEARLKVRKRR